MKCYHFKYYIVFVLHKRIFVKKNKKCLLGHVARIRFVTIAKVEKVL